MNLSDELNTEVDKRKLGKLVESGKISAEDLANAPVYIECPKCKHENIDHVRCANCGEVWE